MNNKVKYCPNCGAEAGENYCSYCGERLKQYEPGQTRTAESDHLSDSDKNTSSELQLVGQGIGIVSVLVLVGGVFLPWAEATALGVELGTIAGTDLRIGALAVVLGTTIGILMILPIQGLHVLSGSLSIIMIGVALLFISDPLLLEGATELERELGQSALDIGVGVYITMFGSVGTLLGSLLSIFSD